MKCSSCRMEFTKGSSFECPGCKKVKIARCVKCKKLGIAYKCSCDFEGP